MSDSHRAGLLHATNTGKDATIRRTPKLGNSLGAIYHHLGCNRSFQVARMGEYKWISSVPRGNRNNLPPTEELFDLVADPGEQNNIVGGKPGVLAQIKQRFASWQAEMDAAEPRGPFRDY